MPDISKLTGNMDGLSLEPSGKISDKNQQTTTETEFLLPSGPQSTGADSKVEELLVLLDNYEKLANGNFRLNFINGCLNISRSNYHSGIATKRYGPDNFDRRSYNASKTVKHKVGGDFTLEDDLQVLKKRKQLEREAKKKQKDDEKQEKKEYTETKEESEISASTSSSQTKLSSAFNRKSKKVDKSKSNETSELKKPNEDSIPITDPIDQFGVLVPPLLYQAQKNFEEWVGDVIQLVNMQKRIQSLVQEIEKQTKETKGN